MLNQKWNFSRENTIGFIKIMLGVAAAVTFQSSLYIYLLKQPGAACSVKGQCDFRGNPIYNAKYCDATTFEGRKYCGVREWLYAEAKD